MLTTAPRGTKDIMPSDVNAWRYLEETMRKICAQYGYKEIRTPVFEHTELFQRGIGDTTDVVEKEMYTFTDRGNRSITLRPENTASAVRAYVEHKLSKDDAATKFYYIGPMFRYDRPQAGRLREFHQFGVEALGVTGPNVDAEIILLAVQVLQSLGLKDLKLKINSVGCPKCRPQHREKLQAFFKPNFDELCKDCQGRFDRNPLRLLDCKNPHCHELGEGAPSLEECLCDECKEHFEGLKQLIIIQKLLLKSSTLRWAHKALFAAAAVTTDWYRKSAVTKPAPASALLWVWSACCWLWRSRICCLNLMKALTHMLSAPSRKTLRWPSKPPSSCVATALRLNTTLTAAA